LYNYKVKQKLEYSAFSGADLSGSGLRILRRNAEQAEVEKNIIDYNAKIGQAQKFE
jgi:hypothetical protein